jgi:hypothetical protein
VFNVEDAQVLALLGVEDESHLVEFEVGDASLQGEVRVRKPLREGLINLGEVGDASLHGFVNGLRDDIRVVVTLQRPTTSILRISWHCCRKKSLILSETRTRASQVRRLISRMHIH